MELRRMKKRAGLIFGFFGIGFVLASIRTVPKWGFHLGLLTSTRESSGATPSANTVAQPATSNPSFAPSVATSQSNILEIPKASVDFVGDWGGYETGTVQDALSGFARRIPAARTAVTFGRTNDTVFLSLEVWAPPDVEIVSKPRAWITDPEEAIVEFESQDYQEYFVDIATYQLHNPGHINYKDDTRIYDRVTRQLLKIQHTHATLKRLTPDAMASWKPPTGWVPKDDLSASKDFNSSDKDGDLSNPRLRPGR
jgi:hypothetical protein